MRSLVTARIQSSRSDQSRLTVMLTSVDEWTTKSTRWLLLCCLCYAEIDGSLSVKQTYKTKMRYSERANVHVHVCYISSFDDFL